MTTKESKQNAEINRAVQVRKFVPFLLAGLEGLVEEFLLQGITLQRVGDGDFRAVIRGWDIREGTDSTRLVSFSNADDPGELLAGLEDAFASGSLRWHIDRYAPNLSKNGTSEDEQRSLTLRK